MGPKSILYVVLFFCAVSVARADTLTFTASGQYNFSFQMSSAPTPYYYQTNQYAQFYPVTVTTPSGTATYTFTFYNGGFGGAFDDYNDGAGFRGQQVYTGSESNPVFSPNVYSFYAYYGDNTVVETLTITSAATPEPSSFLLLFTGVGAAGFAALRKARGVQATRVV